jgi:hypothetical protein
MNGAQASTTIALQSRSTPQHATYMQRLACLVRSRCGPLQEGGVACKGLPACLHLHLLLLLLLLLLVLIHHLATAASQLLCLHACILLLAWLPGAGPAQRLLVVQLQSERPELLQDGLQQC